MEVSISEKKPYNLKLESWKILNIFFVLLNEVHYSMTNKLFVACDSEEM